MRSEKPFPGEPLRPRIQELKRGVIEGEPKEIKHEVYALSTELINHVHEEALALFREHPEIALEVINQKFDLGLGGSLAELDSGGRVRIVPEVARQIPDMYFAEMLAHEMPRLYIRLFERALDARSFRSDERMAKIYDRLDTVLKETNFRGVTEADKVTPIETDIFILRGVHAGSVESWGILVSLALKYQQQFEQSLTVDVLERLSDDLRKVLNRTAGMHIHDLTSFTQYRRDEHRTALQETSWEKALYLGGTPLEPRLVLDQNFLTAANEKYEEEVEYIECTQKCPALHGVTSGEDGKKMNIVSSLFDFQKELAKGTLLPFQENLLRRAREKELEARFKW